MLKIIKYASVADSPKIIDNRLSIAFPQENVDVEECEQAILKAERMIADAMDQAAAIVTQAEQQAELIKKQASEQGYKQGYEDGAVQSKQAVLAEMSNNIEQAALKAQKMIFLAEAESRRLVIESERQIVEIALNVAQKILCREIADNPMAVLPIVISALEKVRDQDQITIKVNPEDYDVVLQAKQDLLMIVGGEHSLTIAADRTISVGGCVIDTAFGSVDAKFDTQFESIRKALQEVLP